MKEIKHYICEICGTEYKDKFKAQKCEKNHCEPINIEKCRYLSYEYNNKGYPVSIDVRMKDGQILTYKK